jgi:hypothetical protein
VVSLPSRRKPYHTLDGARDRRPVAGVTLVEPFQADQQIEDQAIAFDRERHQAMAQPAAKAALAIGRPAALQIRNRFGFQIPKLWGFARALKHDETQQ